MADASTAIKQADDLMTAAAENLQKPIEAPVAKGVDTSKSRKAVEAASKQEEETSRIQRESQRLFESATRTQQTAITQSGQAQADSLAADAARAQEVSNIHSFFADQEGLTVNGKVDTSSHIAALSNAKREQETIALQELDGIRQMQAVGPLDDPLEFFHNAFQLPSKIASYNKRVDAVNNMQRSINSGIETATNASAEVTKTVPLITAAQAAAQGRKVQADAAANVAIADENLAKFNSDYATKLLTDKLSIATATERQTATEIANQRLVYESQINAVRIAENHAQRQLAAAKLITEVGQGRALDALLENYDINMGNPKGTTTRYLFNRLSDDQQKNMAAIGAGSGGSDPYQYLVNVAIKGRPGPELSEEKKHFISWLGDKIPNYAGLLSSVPKELHAQKIGQLLLKEIEDEKTNSGKAGTLFHEISPTNMILAGNAGVPPDSEMAKILEPLTKSTAQPSTEDIVKTISLAIDNPSDAGNAIATYYSKNLALVNSSIPLSMAGVKPMEGYTVKLKVGLLRNLPFDLTKPAEATKYALLLERRDNPMKGYRRQRAEEATP